MTTSFHFTKRLAIGAIVSIGIIAGSVSTAFGWINPGPYGLNDPSTAINFWNNCGPGDKNVMANDGDVVTTQKWNQMNCLHMQIWLSLFDWPRGKTPLIWPNGGLGGVNEINGVKGHYVEALLLASPGGGGGVNFYDANRQFPTQADGRSNVLGYVQYHRANDPGYPGTREGLHLLSANGPVYVDTCLGTDVNPYCDDTTNAPYPSDTPGQYPLGWVDVNLYDTSEFDTNCTYRSQVVGQTSLRYPIWVDKTQISTSLPYVSQGAGLRIAFGYIDSNNKTIFRRTETKMDGTAENINMQIQRIEKLCLPRYKSGVNMNQTFF
jgi:hypothetical protein